MRVFLSGGIMRGFLYAAAAGFMSLYQPTCQKLSDSGGEDQKRSLCLSELLGPPSLMNKLH